MTETIPLELMQRLELLGSYRSMVWALEAEQRKAAVDGHVMEGSKLADLKVSSHVLEEAAWALRMEGYRVCRVCYCTDVSACDPPCSWVETAGSPAELCSACVAEDLERRYLETVHVMGLTFGEPMVASAAKAGDVVVRAMEERIVEVSWPREGPVTIATASRVWNLDPQEAFAHRAVPRSFKALLDPSIAEVSRRAIVVKAFRDGKLHDRERASKLLGIDVETGEALA